MTEGSTRRDPPAPSNYHPHCCPKTAPGIKPSLHSPWTEPCCSLLLCLSVSWGFFLQESVLTFGGRGGQSCLSVAVNLGLLFLEVQMVLIKDVTVPVNSFKHVAASCTHSNQLSKSLSKSYRCAVAAWKPQFYCFQTKSHPFACFFTVIPLMFPRQAEPMSSPGDIYSNKIRQYEDAALHLTVMGT